MRFGMMREMLLNGKTVQMVSGGDSLAPLVEPYEPCVFAPASGKQIKKNDIVFCQVQPGDRWYCHLVWQVDEDRSSGFPKEKFHIGNNRTGLAKRCNGYCFREHVYGILIKTARGDYPPPIGIRHDTITRRHRYTKLPPQPLQQQFRL